MSNPLASYYVPIKKDALIKAAKDCQESILKDRANLREESIKEFIRKYSSTYYKVSIFGKTFKCPFSFGFLPKVVITYTKEDAIHWLEGVKGEQLDDQFCFSESFWKLKQYKYIYEKQFELAESLLAAAQQVDDIIYLDRKSFDSLKDFF
jgi:hypothetical protein